MSDQVQLVECPRDAWQGLSGIIPAKAKADYLRTLIAAGFRQIDAVSFVSPRAVPQMSDSEEVLKLLDVPNGVEIIGIVVNEQGAERAIRTGKVQTLGFPYSISAQFLERNQHQTQAESMKILERIENSARNANIGMVAYISMAFANPYGDAWSAEQVVSACEELVRMGMRQISLADTVGLAPAKTIAEVFAAVRRSIQTDIEIGLHLHARPEEAAGKIHAAYVAGCRRFDTALGGFGGCPFAQDALVGNIATEAAWTELTEQGAQLPGIAHIGALVEQTRALNNEYGHTQNNT